MSETLITRNLIENVSNQHQDDVDVEIDATLAPHSDRTLLLDGGSGSGGDDIPTKKKKTRRGKPKRRNVQPYAKYTWQQRKKFDEMSVNKAKNSKMIAHGQPLAPYNTTQFLIEDHGYMKDIEERLTGNPDNRHHRTGPPRTRDSSFSVDSDVDFYSSPEDEEEFLTKEFSNTYQDIRSERLNTMTREELIQECIQMENKVEMLTKCLGSQSSAISDSINTEDNNDKDNGVIINYRNIKEFQLKVVKLMNENDTLRRENDILRQSRRRRKVNGSFSSSMCSSEDSESDSSTSSSSSSETEQVMDSELVPSGLGENTECQPKTNGHLYSAPSTPASTNSIVSPRATSPIAFTSENHQESGGGEPPTE